MPLESSSIIFSKFAESDLTSDLPDSSTNASMKEGEVAARTLPDSFRKDSGELPDSFRTVSGQFSDSFRFFCPTTIIYSFCSFVLSVVILVFDIYGLKTWSWHRHDYAWCSSLKGSISDSACFCVFLGKRTSLRKWERIKMKKKIIDHLNDQLQGTFHSTFHSAFHRKKIAQTYRDGCSTRRVWKWRLFGQRQPVRAE